MDWDVPFIGLVPVLTNYSGLREVRILKHMPCRQEAQGPFLESYNYPRALLEAASEQ